MRILLCAILLLPTFAAAQQEINVRSFGVLSSPPGRFVFGQLSQYASATYLLDTQTGRLWRMVSTKTSDGSALEALQSIPFIADSGNALQILPPAPPPLAPRK